ncbi:hypothetical protein GCM10023321_40090 [Pseudonocardia eucalypti]|uniref:NlpC/P60 domain-containing protein n=1 Tax=Pseudonocardia eucalypti TaxID=648755 RepID=A0ABP9QCA9_9PSEU|nr:hypothetical protein [Pseudonocardia eucalypti]
MPYAGWAYPGAPAPGPIEHGANCQRYAYAVLELFGIRLPALRSSDLWADTVYTDRVIGPPRPLDLWLFNRSAEAYGAHVGVWLAEGQILHLCRAVGRPVVWAPDDFAREPWYRALVGAKRPNHPAEVTESPC